jgi:hypothetical protein
MNRLAYWKAKLKAALVVSRQRQKEAQQATRAWVRATRKVEQIEQKVEHETTKLARSK